MLFRFVLKTVALPLLLLSGCASMPAGEADKSLLDLFAEQNLTLPGNTGSVRMVAEVVWVRETQADFLEYRYRIEERQGIRERVLTLLPGRYEIAFVCTESEFSRRYLGFLNLESEQWGRFALAGGNSGLLPVHVMTLSLQGGELITPVNMVAESDRFCRAVYAQQWPNTAVQSLPDSEIRQEYEEWPVYYGL